jgi:hypothetical protein
MMTVNELVEMLKNYPGDMRVLTLGYEGGYNDTELKTEEIVFNFSQNDAWYYGPHECVKFTDEQTGTPCVIIMRGK